MASDYKKLLNKNKKKKFADPKNMGVNIDKNESDGTALEHNKCS